MKRKNLIKHLLENGCILEREGSKHSLFYNPEINKSATVPRHKEINTFTAKGICRDLGIQIIKLK
jgi:mRNA interferase HicA